MSYIENYEKWLKYDFLDTETKKELEEMKGKDDIIKECFYDYLSFGTAGMRGIMGVGINRFNTYTVRRASQGFSDYLNKNNLKNGIVITYDTRNNSKKYALDAALNFCANGIKVYTFKSERPTPFLSYAILQLKADGGVNITASHNSKEYNGYKLYLSDGGQFSYPDDEKIIECVNMIDDLTTLKTMPEKEAIDKKLLVYLDDKLDKKFKLEAENKIINKNMVRRNGKDLKIVYTPLHGTGSIFLKDAFKEVGFTDVTIVKSQDDKNGDFKTVKKPNPEEKEAFNGSIKIAKVNDADIIIATDPDADRTGIAVRTKKGEYKLLTGNEMSCLMLYYTLYFNKRKKVDMKNAYVVKSFVTTRMQDVICESFKTNLITTLTGFKWICKAIVNNSDKKFLFASEESYGFMVSDFVHDKDSIATALVLAEIALAFKIYLKFTLFDYLELLNKTYGYYKCFNQNIEFPGVAGKSIMKNIMDTLRKDGIKKVTDIEVIKVEDYLTGIRKDLITNKDSKINLPKTDALIYYLSDNTKISIRPSGTEPKVKLYYDIVDESAELSENKFEILKQAMTKILKSGE